MKHSNPFGCLSDEDNDEAPIVKSALDSTTSDEFSCMNGDAFYISTNLDQQQLLDLSPSCCTSLGPSLSTFFGTSLGTLLGTSLGTSLGLSPGTSLGTLLGTNDKTSLVGPSLGTSPGCLLGTSIGTSFALGTLLGTSLGASFGLSPGTSLATLLGTSLESVTMSHWQQQHSPPAITTPILCTLFKTQQVVVYDLETGIEINNNIDPGGLSNSSDVTLFDNKLYQSFGFCSCSQQQQASYKSCMTPQLHYFDCYDTEDDIIFVDCLEDFPVTFKNCLDYQNSCYFDFYSQYHKTYTDKLTGFNRATSLQGAFVSNNNDFAAVFDLDNIPSNVSVSDTSKTKVDNMDCSNVPEKEIIPPSSMDYSQLIT